GGGRGGVGASPGEGGGGGGGGRVVAPWGGWGGRGWGAPGGRGARLHGTDAHDADLGGARRRDHRAWLGRTGKELQAARRVEQIGDALDRRRRGTFAQHLDQGIGLADAGDTPGTDEPFADEPFEGRPHGVDEGRIG